MKILLVSSEVHPYSKTGGLGDMVGALARTLAQAGHRVGLVTPLYSGIRQHYPTIRPAAMTLDLPLGPRRVKGAVCPLDASRNLTIYFVEQPDFFDRKSIYHENGVDYPDNAERFVFLSKAAVHLARNLPWEPELVHAHDWQAATTALLIHHEKAAGWGTAPRTCLTIHNLLHQGVFPGKQFELMNLPWTYFTADGVEFYTQFNCLKAGIVYADTLSTVSPRYAREITTPEFGCGLDGLLRHRQDALTGILNGADYSEWNTETNPFLRYPYSPEDLSGKTSNKTELQRECGLVMDEKIPLFGSVGRLVGQKGSDLLLGALEEMLAANFQFVMIGTGESRFEQAFLNLARRYPAKTCVRIGFDQGMSHRIEAGADFFLMPSRFEPCGLNQMYSLRYATVPIVRATGGLDDSVIDITEDAAQANGIKFSEPSGHALARAIRKALALYAEPDLLYAYRLNGMAADFSWNITAEKYVETWKNAMVEATLAAPDAAPKPA